jgi:hypothetical protein
MDNPRLFYGFNFWPYAISITQQRSAGLEKLPLVVM